MSESEERSEIHMSKDEKKEQIESMAEKFVELDAEHKARIVGYMDGVRDERQKWLDKEKKTAVVTA